MSPFHTYRPPVAAYSRGFAPLAKKLSILRDPSSSAVGARPRWTLPACAVERVASSAATSDGVDSASARGRSTFGRRLRPGSWKAHSLGRFPSGVSTWKLLATMQGTHTGRPVGIALRAATPPFAIEGGMPNPLHAAKHRAAASAIANTKMTHGPEARGRVGADDCASDSYPCRDCLQYRARSEIMQFVTASITQRIATRAHDCLLEPSSAGWQWCRSTTAASSRVSSTRAMRLAALPCHAHVPRAASDHAYPAAHVAARGSSTRYFRGAITSVGTAVITPAWA